MFLFDHRNPELEGMVKELGASERTRGPHVMIDRAIARGELPLGTNRAMLVAALRVTVLFRSLLADTAFDEAASRELVDMLLDGALASRPPRKRR